MWRVTPGHHTWDMTSKGLLPFAFLPIIAVVSGPRAVFSMGAAGRDSLSVRFVLGCTVVLSGSNRKFFLEVSAAQQPQRGLGRGSQGTLVFFPCPTDESLVCLHPWFMGGENWDWVILRPLKTGRKNSRREALAHLSAFPWCACRAWC